MLTQPKSGFPVQERNIKIMGSGPRGSMGSIKIKFRNEGKLAPHLH